MNLWNRPTEEEQRLGLNDDVDHLNQKSNHLQALRKHDEEQGSSSQPSSRFKSRINGHGTRGEGDKGNGEGSQGGGQPHMKKIGLELDGEILILGNAEDKAMNRFESIYSDRCEGPTNVDEVWFSGSHGGM